MSAVTYSIVEVVLVELAGEDTLRGDLFTAMIDGVIPGAFRSFGGTGAKLTVAWQVGDWPAVRAWLEVHR